MSSKEGGRVRASRRQAPALCVEALENGGGGAEGGLSGNALKRRLPDGLVRGRWKTRGIVSLYVGPVRFGGTPGVRITATPPSEAVMRNLHRSSLVE
jgi:hypothetical protein